MCWRRRREILLVARRASKCKRLRTTNTSLRVVLPGNTLRLTGDSSEHFQFEIIHINFNVPLERPPGRWQPSSILATRLKSRSAYSLWKTSAAGRIPTSFPKLAELIMWMVELRLQVPQNLFSQQVLAKYVAPQTMSRQLFPAVNSGVRLNDECWLQLSAGRQPEQRPWALPTIPAVPWDRRSAPELCRPWPNPRSPCGARKLPAPPK